MSRAYNDIYGLIDSIRADSTRVGVGATLARIIDELSLLNIHCGIQQEDLSGTRETGTWTAGIQCRSGISIDIYLTSFMELLKLREEFDGKAVKTLHGGARLEPNTTVSIPFTRSVSDVRVRVDYSWGYVEGGIARVDVTQSMSSLVHCVRSLMEEKGLTTGMILDILYNCLSSDIDRDELKKKLNQCKKARILRGDEQELKAIIDRCL